MSATFGTSASSFEETASDEEKLALCRTLQPNKNAVISKIKKRRLQLEKVVRKCCKKFRTIRTFLRLQGTLHLSTGIVYHDAKLSVIHYATYSRALQNIYMCCIVI